MGHLLCGIRNHGRQFVRCYVVTADQEEVKDYKDVPLNQIGFTPFKPAKDSGTGFVVGGKNATDLVCALTEINGRKIAELEKDMRPGALGGAPMGDGLGHFEGSSSGFVGKDEKLLDVLAMDNAFVVDKLGLSHQDIARPLLIAPPASIRMLPGFKSR